MSGGEGSLAVDGGGEWRRAWIGKGQGAARLDWKIGIWGIRIWPEAAWRISFGVAVAQTEKAGPGT